MIRKLAPLALASLVAMSMPASADITSNTATTVTVAAGTNAFTAPTALAFTATVTGASQSVTGTWTGTFQISDLSGSGSPWSVGVTANQFSGTPPVGLAKPDIANLNLAAPNFTSSSTGFVAGDFATSAITGVTGSSQTVINSNPGGDARPGNHVFTPVAAGTTIGLPANIAAGTYTTNLVYTAIGL
ncbi:hypothetical protein JST97_13570 [bacterium]|nr:hypothetical protein [bacterium]